MRRDARPLTKEDLISEVITPNLPSAWVKDFRLLKLDQETKISNILEELLVIEEQVKVEKKNIHKENTKNLKNPCCVHNGGHEWYDCHENPKNKKTEKGNQNGGAGNNNQRNNGFQNRNNPRGNNNNGRPNREELRNTKPGNDRNNNRRNDTDDEEYESNQLITQEMKNTPSAEILITIPRSKGAKQYRTYLGLIDTGTSSSLINKDIINSSNFTMKITGDNVKWVTQAGTFETDSVVEVENYVLPQFTNKRKITTDFHVFQKSQQDTYDLILGRNILTSIGFNILYDTNKFMWQDIQVDMVPRGHWSRKNISSFWKQFKIAQEEANLTVIKPAEYKLADITEVAGNQKHLSLSKRNKLRTLLAKFQPLFMGKRGNYNGPPIQLELLHGSKPLYGKLFPIPQAYQKITRDEINRLEENGILVKVSSSEWAAPTFIIPKKNQTVRVITDFRGLNKCLKRKPYPMPWLPNIFHSLEKFCYATTINLNMGYYSMTLDKEAQSLCIISLPWGLYQYTVLPQGVKVATDIFQERMGALFLDMAVVVVYMDDIIIFGYTNFDAHSLDVEEVL